MKPLTFPGFTKKYVAELSLASTTAIYPLTREAVSANPRLREPLLLYALANGREQVLLTAARHTPLYEPYQALLRRYDYAELLSALREQDPSLPPEYRKVWSSYVSVSQKGQRDRRVKAQLRINALRLQAEKGVSTYRICKDLGLNNSNVNYWLKNGDGEKISLNAARRILAYLQNGDTAA